MDESPKPKSVWRILRRISITLAVLATLIALFYTEEDWRGKWAWENYEHQLEAQGMVIDWNKFIPPAVPDDQNFYTANTNLLLRFKQFSEDDTNAIVAVSQLSWLNLNISSNSFPIFQTSKRATLIVANIIISPRVDNHAGQNKNTLALPLKDSAMAQRAQKLINGTIGKTIAGMQGFEFSQFQLNKLQPAQIFVQADTAPPLGDLQNLIPSETIGEHGHLQVVATANPQIYQVQLINLRITSADDYLAWSDQFVPAFDEIREALKRPYTIIPGDYSVPSSMPIPNFVTLRALAQTLAQRAQCELLLGKPDQALHELTLVHDVCRILEKPHGQPELLIEAMINVAIAGLYEATIAQGLQKHQWQEPQLAAFQQQLSNINLPPYVFESFREMPAHLARNAEVIPPQQWDSLVGGKSHWSMKAVLFWLMPRGWVYQNIIVAVQMEQLPLNGFDPDNGTLSPHTFNASMHKTQTILKQHSPYHFFADIAVPNFSKVWQTTAHNQTLVNEAQIACALERYHLAHGEYPETLDALVPQFMETVPHDLIGGQPLHYRRTDDGKFLLYSVGWNETDDGGQEPPNNKNGSIDYTNGDWVWPN